MNSSRKALRLEKWRIRSWEPAAAYHRLTTIDAHAAGEPLRVIVDGYPPVAGDSMLARRRFAREQYDELRRALMWEPRGHADMYGCIVTPPVSPEADFGVLFLHNEGYSTMCGHGIIAVTTVAAETGLIDARSPRTTVRIDTPAGLVTAFAMMENGRARRVAFHNVPAFVVALDEKVQVEGLGPVHYDLAFGGAYYAFVDAGRLGLALAPENCRTLVEAGMAIKHAVMAGRSIEHPGDPELGFLYGTIFTGPPVDPQAFGRNVCIFAEGEVDRSPTGTGVSARMAIHFARGECRVGESLVIESLIGTRFSGRIHEIAKFGPYDAVIPEVEGSAFITGRHEFLLHPEDALRYGFLLR